MAAAAEWMAVESEYGVAGVTRWGVFCTVCRWFQVEEAPPPQQLVSQQQQQQQQQERQQPQRSQQPVSQRLSRGTVAVAAAQVRYGDTYWRARV